VFVTDAKGKSSAAIMKQIKADQTLIQLEGGQVATDYEL
jgi:hypothetical protein